MQHVWGVIYRLRVTHTLWRSHKFNNSTLLIAWLKPGFGSLDIHLSQLDERRDGDGA